jgi:hypothetical protein
MNPIDRPRTKSPLRVPICTPSSVLSSSSTSTRLLTLRYSSASSLVNAPEDLRRSQKQTAAKKSPSVPDLDGEMDGTLTDGSIDVEDEVLVLLGRDILDGERIVQEGVAGELLPDKGDDELDSEVGVRLGLDLVSDTGDCERDEGQWKNSRTTREAGVLSLLALGAFRQRRQPADGGCDSLAHAVDKLARRESEVHRARKLRGSSIEGSSESVSDGEESSDEGRDEVLSSTGGDDGRHRSRDGGSLSTRVSR